MSLDVPQMVAMSGRMRREYAVQQPTFWREAWDSDAVQAPFLVDQLSRAENIALVAEEDSELRGFIIALLRGAPPVYDPGGLTCIVDDFAVRAESDWCTVGTRLLDAALQAAKARGAVQMVVVCGHHDEPKQQMLASGGYSIVSEWHTRAI